MAYPIIPLKAGREANVGFHHPWIFSGALSSVPSGITHGDLVHVADRQGTIIGTGTFSARSSIAVRVFDFKKAAIDEAWFVRRLQVADERRRLLGFGPGTDTTGYRVVFSEADGLPGLVIDRYGETFVVQISTAGMDRLRPHILAACQTLWSPAAIVERSDLVVRKEEGLQEVVAVHVGEAGKPVPFLEHGLHFTADVLHGQKTGFFLDQKDLRAAVGKLASGRRVLNLFSYTGATTVAALRGGATSVHNVDESAPALAQIAEHIKVNKLDTAASTAQEADVFTWLHEAGDATYDMVIVDPPALVKSRGEKESAAKAYHFLNRAALRLVADGGIFVTSSCSRFFSEEDMAFMLRRASVQAGVTFDVLEVLRQAPDHPVSIYFPESVYLKSFIGGVRAL
jgi:23S rRNA (cytosine1962-C5)-methyltransferase